MDLPRRHLSSLSSLSLVLVVRVLRYSPAFLFVSAVAPCSSSVPPLSQEAASRGRRGAEAPSSSSGGALQALPANGTQMKKEEKEEELDSHQDVHGVVDATFAPPFVPVGEPRPTDKPFEDFVREDLKGKHVHVGTFRVKKASDKTPMEYVSVKCQQHENEHGDLCEAVFKYEMHHGMVHLSVKGEHAPLISKGQARKTKAAVAKQMAANPITVATQMQQRIDAGDDPSTLPTVRNVYDARTAGRRSEHGPGESTGSQWEAAFNEWAPKPDDAEWKLVVDPTHSIRDAHILVLRCKYLTSLCAGFAAKQGENYKFRLCCDATHDKGIQKFKLVSLGWLGVHFTDGEWSTTFVPLGFTFAPEELWG
eukprot:9499894-Pyramimonas_sp.AAC.1